MISLDSLATLTRAKQGSILGLSVNPQEFSFCAEQGSHRVSLGNRQLRPLNLGISAVVEEHGGELLIFSMFCPFQLGLWFELEKRTRTYAFGKYTIGLHVHSLFNLFSNPNQFHFRMISPPLYKCITHICCACIPHACNLFWRLS